MIDFLFSGGVSIKLKSLKLDKAAFNVLGIGVAVSDKTSIELFIFFIFSFARTPNLCSSSITSNLKLSNIIPEDNAAWVPMIISIFPFSISIND